jgi:hypothetical protein
MGAPPIPGGDTPPSPAQADGYSHPAATSEPAGGPPAGEEEPDSPDLEASDSEPDDSQ